MGYGGVRTRIHLTSASGIGSTICDRLSLLISAHRFYLQAGFAFRVFSFSLLKFFLFTLSSLSCCTLLHNHPRAADTRRRAYGSDSGRCSGWCSSMAVSRATGKDVSHLSELLDEVWRELVRAPQSLFKSEEDGTMRVF